MTDVNGSADAGNPEGTVAPSGDDWRASLPDDIKAEASLASIKDIPSLAKSYVSAQKMIGAKRIVVPGEKSPPEEWGEFRKAIGVPDTPDGYKIEGVDADPALLGAFQQVAHKAGVPASAAAELVKWFDEAGKQAQEADHAAKVKEAEEWRGKLGSKADERIGAAKSAMAALGLKPEQVDRFDDMLKAMGAEGVLGVDLLAELYTKHNIGREADMKGGGAGGMGTSSPEAARAAIRAFEASDEYIKAARDQSAPNRADVLAKRDALYRLAYPEAGEGITIVGR